MILQTTEPQSGNAGSGASLQRLWSVGCYSSVVTGAPRVLRGCQWGAPAPPALCNHGGLLRCPGAGEPCRQVTQRCSSGVSQIPAAGFHRHHFWNSLPLLPQPGTRLLRSARTTAPLPASLCPPLAFTRRPRARAAAQEHSHDAQTASCSPVSKPRLLDHLIKSLFHTSP